MAAPQHACLETLETLMAVQEEIETLNDSTAAAILELESKAQREREELLKRRSELVASLPRFWLSIMLNDPVIARILSKLDLQVLSHVTSFELHPYEDVRAGWKFILRFDGECPFFPERELEKCFTVDSEGVLDATAVNPSWSYKMLPPGHEAMDLLSREPERAAAAAGPDPRCAPVPRMGPNLERNSFMEWFTRSETIGFACRDELAEHLKRSVLSNPLVWLLRGNAVKVVPAPGAKRR